MCHAVTCKTCGKATWAGCGRHVEQALAGVPRRTVPRPRPAREPGLLRRLFGGRS